MAPRKDHLLMIPSDIPLTSYELNRYKMHWNMHTEPILFCEYEDHIRYMDQELSPTPVPVYLPEGEEFRNIPVPRNSLYRSSATGGCWIHPPQYFPLRLDDAVREVDVLEAPRDRPELCWHHYHLTRDPAEEVPCREFKYELEDGYAVITAPARYCERVHIPAYLDGFRVRKVLLETHLFGENLRELVIEPGVHWLDSDFYFPHLEVLQLPHSIQLIQPPYAIHFSPWYAAQERDIYLGGYYCGTNGDGDSSLFLKEGTIGVILNAQGSPNLERIFFPTTIQFIGERAFSQNNLTMVYLPEGTKELLRAFENRPVQFHFSSSKDPEAVNCWNTEKERLLAHRPAAPLTGLELFQLGRTCAAAQAMIPPGYLPMPPRLRYRNGWIAEYWYFGEEFTPSFYIALQLPSGLPLEAKQLPQQVPDGSSFLCSYLPPTYHRAERYLKHCAELVNDGEPPVSDLEALQQEWLDAIPCYIARVLRDASPTPIPCSVWGDCAAPANLSCSWTLDRLKDAMLTSAGTTEEALITHSTERGGTS